jgi:hypothetical protein
MANVFAELVRAMIHGSRQMVRSNASNAAPWCGGRRGKPMQMKGSRAPR